MRRRATIKMLRSTHRLRVSRGLIIDADGWLTLIERGWQIARIVRNRLRSRRARRVGYTTDSTSHRIARAKAPSSRESTGGGESAGADGGIKCVNNQQIAMP